MIRLWKERRELRGGGAREDVCPQELPVAYGISRQTLDIAMWPWANHFNSLILCFLLHNIV